MKNAMKKAMMICLVAAMALSGFACSSVGKNDSQIEVETIDMDNPALKHDLEFTIEEGNAEDATEVADNGSTAETEIETEVETEVVEVTDEAGEKVTEADGQPVTEVVEKIVEKVVEKDNSGSAYTPSTQNCRAFFLNMTKKADFVFDGEFLVLEFKIKEGTPDGVYPITIVNPDIANWDAESVVPTVFDGEVVVGNAQSKKQAANADGFALDISSAKGNPGDVVKVVVNCKNNPGFCGFVLNIEFDGGALESYDKYGGADFDASVNFVTPEN